MAFVSNEGSPVLASFSQSAVRNVAVGDDAEVVFTSVPGATFSGKVERIVALGSDAQLSASSQLPAFTGAPANDRWVVVVALDDQQFARQLPQGSGGKLAVYTRYGKPFHLISKVTLRMGAWLAYLTTP
jgi:multidrug resistance efflux pump